jgi:hypothetical protein
MTPCLRASLCAKARPPAGALVVLSVSLCPSCARTSRPRSGMVVLQDNAAASKAFHAVSSGSVSAAVEAGIVVEWLQPTGAPDDTHAGSSSATPAATLPTPPDGDAARGRGSEPHAVPAARENGAAESRRGDAADHSSNQEGGAVGRSGGRGEGEGGNRTGGASMPSFSSWQPAGSAPDDSILSHRDYESITLMRCPPPPSPCNPRTLQLPSIRCSNRNT